MKIKRLSLTLVAVVAWGSQGGFQSPGQARADEPKAAEKASRRAQVVEFLRKHAVGKTLATSPLTFKLDDAKVEVAGEDQISLSNLVETPEGFKFDLTSVSKVSSYDLDPDGKRSSPGRDWSGVTVVRYELKELRSTGALIGLARLVSSTVKDFDVTGVAAGVQVAFREDQLTLKESGVLYGDQLAAKGEFKPGSSEGTTRLSLKEGKLRLDSDNAAFDVDPETLKRTPSKDKLPTITYMEIERSR
jgi:hypothetical protein